jgi:hypothetical protein
MLKWCLISMLNKWILIIHKCRFITWRCGSYFCYMCFTIFSDSTPRGGNIFYGFSLQSERRLSFLVLSELVGSEIGVLRNLSPTVSLAFFIFIDLRMYLLLLILTALSSPSFRHTICFTGRKNLISFNNYKKLFTSLRQLTEQWLLARMYVTRTTRITRISTSVYIYC